MERRIRRKRPWRALGPAAGRRLRWRRPHRELDGTTRRQICLGRTRSGVWNAPPARWPPHVDLVDLWQHRWRGPVGSRRRQGRGGGVWELRATPQPNAWRSCTGWPRTETSGSVPAPHRRGGAAAAVVEPPRARARRCQAPGSPGASSRRTGTALNPPAARGPAANGVEIHDRFVHASIRQLDVGQAGRRTCGGAPAGVNRAGADVAALQALGAAASPVPTSAAAGEESKEAGAHRRSARCRAAGKAVCWQGKRGRGRLRGGGVHSDGCATRPAPRSCSAWM